MLLRGVALLTLGFLSAAQPGDGPRFAVETVDGPLPAAPLARLDKDWSLRTEAAKEPLSDTEWVGLRQPNAPLPPPLSQHFVLLTGGDRLPFAPAAPPQLKNGRLALAPAAPLRVADGKELSLFLPYVALIFLTVPEGIDQPDRFLDRLEREERANDVVYLRNGDRIEGSVKGLDETGCRTVAEERAITTPWERLAGIAFGTRSLARPRLRKQHGRAVLAGGARVHFADLRFDTARQRWAGRTPYGAALALAASDLLALDLLRGPAVYLSELEPARYEHTPYLGVAWPLGKDRSLTGGPLRLGRGYYDKGLSMHAASRVTYRLDGQYRRFEALAGLDEGAGPRGRVRLAALVDGKRYDLDDGRERTANSPPLPVRLDVRGAKELTLLVEFGSFGDVQANAAWANARLVKDEK